MRNVVIKGKFVDLVEIQPEYFQYVIDWRNNPELNRFLNQPFKLTMELQEKWYKEKYLNDETQGLFVMVDKNNNVPFATLGWTDMDRNTHICIEGRAICGNPEYLASKELTEGYWLVNEYLYEKCGIQEMYIHVVNENKKIISLNKRWGYHTHGGEAKFPHELFVNGMHQTEYVRTYEEYQPVRKKILKLLEMF